MKLETMIRIFRVVEKVMVNNNIRIKGIKPSELDGAIEEALTSGKHIKEILKPVPDAPVVEASVAKTEIKSDPFSIKQKSKNDETDNQQ